MLHMRHLSGPPLSTIPPWILVCSPGYLPPAYCLTPSSWNYCEWPIKMFWFFVFFFLLQGMTDINQWIRRAASSRSCLQTCPCLQVSLCPTKARSTDGHLDLWQARPKSTMSMWYRTSANPLTPLAQHRHCCMAPKQQIRSKCSGLNNLVPGFQTAGWSPRGLPGLCLFTPDSCIFI